MRYSRGLFLSLLQWLALFKLNLGAGGVTIISYPELALDFVEFMNENKSFQEDEELPDLYSDEVVEDLTNVCHDIRFARTFELLSPDQELMTNVLNYTNSEDVTPLKIVRYEDIEVKVGEFHDEIAMFPCYKDSDFGYVYITPGYFQQDFKFLFKRRDLRMNPVIIGLVEPRPAVDERFHDQRHLEKYFVQAYRLYEPKSKNPLSLNSLNGHQHFRLCSLLEDARRIDMQDNGGEPFLEVEENHQLGMEETFEVTFKALDKLNPVYATLEVYVATLPCFTNNGNITFFVSENPKDPDSVFVLEKRINPDSKKREVFVAHHVNDIALLKNMDKFY